MKRFTFGVKVLTLGCALLPIASCKSRTDSDVESLSMYNGTLSNSMCSAEPSKEFNELFDNIMPKKADQKNLPINAAPGYASYLEEVLPTVPMGLLSWYFRFGGKLHLITNVETMCARDASNVIMLPFTNDDGKLAGCVRGRDMRGSGQSREFALPTIYVQIQKSGNELSVEDVRKSISNTVQGFAIVKSYITAELKVNGAANANSGVLMTLGNNELLETKKSLASALVKDLINETKKPADKRTFATIPKEISENIFDAKVLDANLKDNERDALFKKAQSQDKYIHFVNMIFSQVLAADWCSDATRAQLLSEKTIWTETAKVYAPQREALAEALSLEEPQVATDTSTSTEKTEGLSLTSTQDLVNYRSNGRPARFPLLRQVILLPFAAAEYFIENRPVLTFFQRYQPLRRTVYVAGQVGRGVVYGTGRLLQTTGRVVTSLPIIRRFFR